MTLFSYLQKNLLLESVLQNKNNFADYIHSRKLMPQI